MKRDMGIIRDILLSVEARTEYKGARRVELDGVDQREVDYNAGLLLDAGYVKGYTSRTKMTSPSHKIENITWDGHEFLDAARNDTVWGRFKAKAKEYGGPMPFEVAKALMIQLAKEAALGRLG